MEEKTSLHLQTPLLYSSSLSAIASRPVYLKLENVQPGGSFKIRGIGNLCLQAKRRGCTHIVSSSGGNAGVAAALAGRLLGMQVIVCVPTTTPERMRSLISDEGAAVIVHGNVWDEADQEARRILNSYPEGTAAYVSPFNHPDIWDGHATLVDEAKQQLNGVKPAAVVVSVGGGGLFLGVERGLARNDWADVPIIACETSGAESFAKMYEAKELVTLPAITSLAKSLGALRVAEECLHVIIRGKAVVPYVMDDQIAVDAVLRFANDHRMLVEPSCGAALAFAYNPSAVTGFLNNDGPLLVVVCGGNLISLEQIMAWNKRHENS